MKKNVFLMMFAAAAIAFAGCSENSGDEPAPENPTLSVTPTSISATTAAGTYAVSVTSNAAWTATVDAAATWCTVAPASATGNGTVTVNVTGNATVESRAATITFTAGSLTRTVAVTQTATAPMLEVDKTTINATATAATYTIGVTSNGTWTAAVDAAATWCTVAPASATGNGTVTVNVTGNATVEPRAATITVTGSGTLTRTVTVAQALFTPTYAASTNTWVFGNQVWSDAIQIPECNKTDFVASYDQAQCRSYTESGITWYYYNYAYVSANASSICPSPWHVPTKEDFDALVAATTYGTLNSEWGFGGHVVNSESPQNFIDWSMYWSVTEFNSSIVIALYVMDFAYRADWTDTQNGLPVRCVNN